MTHMHFGTENPAVDWIGYVRKSGILAAAALDNCAVELDASNNVIHLWALPGRAQFVSKPYLDAVATAIGVYFWRGSDQSIPLLVVNALDKTRVH